MNYNKYTLEDICSIITDYVANGSFKSLAQNVEYKTKKDCARLIRLYDRGNKYDEKDAIWIPESSYEFLKKSKLYGGEIIIANVGANLGTTFLCPKLPYAMSLGPNSIMLKTNEKCDQNYLYYYLISKDGQSRLASIVSGSAMPKFNKTDLRKIELELPSIETQKKVSKLLADIDAKIECNNRTNDNLHHILYCPAFIR